MKTSAQNRKKDGSSKSVMITRSSEGRDEVGRGIRLLVAN